MVDEVLEILRSHLSLINKKEHLLIVLPSEESAEIVVYTEHRKATVRWDAALPAYVITSRDSGELVTWSDEKTVSDALRQALFYLTQTTGEVHAA